MKKDKSKILGIGCIIFAVFIIVISGIQYLNKEKKSEEKRNDSEFYEQTADYDFDDTDNSTGELETTTITETTEEELDDNVEPLVYEDFEIQDLTEEEKAAIGENYDTLVAAIQETMYACGFYDYTYAVSLHDLEINDEAGTVTLSMEVMANKQEQVADTVDRLDGKVTALEGKPGKRWDNLVEKLIWAVVAAVAGFFLAQIGLG